jgi:hypothetical protein
MVASTSVPHASGARAIPTPLHARGLEEAPPRARQHGTSGIGAGRARHARPRTRNARARRAPARQPIRLTAPARHAGRCARARPSGLAVPVVRSASRGVWPPGSLERASYDYWLRVGRLPPETRPEPHACAAMAGTAGWARRLAGRSGAPCAAAAGRVRVRATPMRGRYGPGTAGVSRPLPLRLFWTRGSSLAGRRPARRPCLRRRPGCTAWPCHRGAGHLFYPSLAHAVHECVIEAAQPGGRRSEWG